MKHWASTSVVADGVRLAVHRTGEGPPVVCLTALAHDRHDFDGLASRIADRFELICIEWPLHGDSGADRHAASARRYAELLTAALTGLAIANPFIVGNSIGAGAAILHARAQPVRGLALCDSSGLVTVTPLVARICRLYAALFAAGERGAWWFRPVFGVYYRTVLTRPPAFAQRRRIVDGAHRLAGTLRVAWQGFGRPEASLAEDAAALDVPIWVAWARGDRTIPLRLCLPAISRLRHATLSTFRGGHTPFLEDPDAFAEGFVAFAQRLADGDTVHAARRAEPSGPSVRAAA